VTLIKIEKKRKKKIEDEYEAEDEEDYRTDHRLVNVQDELVRIR
jgi:hypothetical protein